MFTALGIVFLYILYFKIFYRSAVLLTQIQREEEPAVQAPPQLQCWKINSDRLTVSLKSVCFYTPSRAGMGPFTLVQSLDKYGF